jgi:hypothetical protein
VRGAEALRRIDHRRHSTQHFVFDPEDERAAAFSCVAVRSAGARVANLRLNATGTGISGEAADVTFHQHTDFPS